MFKKKFVKIFIFSISIFIIFGWFYLKYFNKNKNILKESKSSKENYKSNIIENVEYTSKDLKGNKYTIIATQGEIDISNPNMIFLTEVKALIQPLNFDDITIKSDYGKYNSDNFDTIFSKNIIISYSDHKITGGYLDFSLEKNLMLISKNVIYSNNKNTMKSDVIELDIQTKDTKIFMHNVKDKVNIKNN